MTGQPYDPYDATKPYPRVRGVCPMGCGETLFVGASGWITCSYIPCPDPTRVSDVLLNLVAVGS